jgi:hypothetical protein
MIRRNIGLLRSKHVRHGLLLSLALQAARRLLLCVLNDTFLTEFFIQSNYSPTAKIRATITVFSYGLRRVCCRACHYGISMKVRGKVVVSLWNFCGGLRKMCYLYNYGILVETGEIVLVRNCHQWLKESHGTITEFSWTVGKHDRLISRPWPEYEQKLSSDGQWEWSNKE